MMLVVDIGNTQTVAGLYPPEAELGSGPTTSWRTRTLRDRTGDEIAVQVAQLLELRGFSLADVDECIISSVVPTQTEAWEQFGRGHLETSVTVVGPGTRTGMPIRVDNPHEVGADRIVNGIAAWHRYEGACVVIDMGTATTLDAIAPDGAYVGGAISPGLGISVDALVQRAARLASVELAVPEHAIGTNTVTSMQSGSLLGCVAQLEGLLTRFRREMADGGVEGHIPAIATGGLAPLVAPHVLGLDDADPDLTLRGLHLVAARIAARPG